MPTANSALRMRGAAAQDERYRKSTIHRHVRTCATFARTESKTCTCTNRNRLGACNGNAIHGDFKVSAGRRHQRIALEFEFGTRHRDLERRRRTPVSNKRVCQTMGKRIHGTSDRDTQRLKTPSSSILDRRMESRPEDVNPSGCHEYASGTNRTRSPARKSDGADRLRSNGRTSVRPINCHPPGVSAG